jgi:hypothetical protein
VRAWTGALLVGLFVLFAAAPSAGATVPGLQPLDLRVEGGEESWRAEPSFSLRWRNPNPAGPAVAAVHYRLLGPTGGVALGDTRVGWAASSIEGLRVPQVPGAYTAEVWLENADRELGAPVPARLRFDDEAPGNIEVRPAAGWIGRNAFPYTLRLEHPAGPAPLSGIRGYAVSIDRDGDGGPCGGPDMCSELETDLRGGALDSLAVDDLPEGTSYVHAVAVSGSGMRSRAVGTSALRVDKTDPVTRLSGVADDWSSQPLTLVASASDGGSGMAVADGSPFTAIRIDGGRPSVATGDRVSASVIASGVHVVAYYARDAAGNVDDGAVVNGRPNHPPATAAVRIDRDEPELSFANAQDPADPERIEARASDSLSGLDPSRGWISLRRADSDERFERLPTAIDAGLLRARWDSDAYPAGEYEFRVTAFDRAGNEASTQRRANGMALSLRNPLKIATRVLAGFGGPVLEWHRCQRKGTRRHCRAEAVRDFEQRPPRRTVPYGHGTWFSGLLIAGRRAPVAGAPVQVIERFEGGAAAGERTTIARTGGDGAFSLRLAPGPSREVVVVAPATPTLRAASSQSVRLAVRSRVRMRSSAPVAQVGGRPVVFSGSLDGGNIAAEEKAVQLQFRLPGLPWSEFRTVHADGRGGFRYAYRFADDDSRGARFQFRAYVPAQADWPFEPAGSRPVTVRGG